MRKANGNESPVLLQSYYAVSTTCEVRQIDPPGQQEKADEALIEAIYLKVHQKVPEAVSNLWDSFTFYDQELFYKVVYNRTPT
jgi:hypothetical protein